MIERMNRSEMYWLKLPLEHLGGTLLIHRLFAGTISGFLGQTKPNWRAISL